MHHSEKKNCIKKKTLGDKKIQRVSIAASDKKFVNRREDGKSREGSEEERSQSFLLPLFYGDNFQFFCYPFSRLSMLPVATTKKGRKTLYHDKKRPF